MGRPALRKVEKSSKLSTEHLTPFGIGSSFGKKIVRATPQDEV